MSEERKRRHAKSGKPDLPTVLYLLTCFLILISPPPLQLVSLLAQGQGNIVQAPEEVIIQFLDTGGTLTFKYEKSYDSGWVSGSEAQFYNITLGGRVFKSLLFSSSSCNVTWVGLKYYDGRAELTLEVYGSGVGYLYFNTFPPIFTIPPYEIVASWLTEKIYRDSMANPHDIGVNRFWWNGSMLYVKLKFTSGGTLVIKWSESPPTTPVTTPTTTPTPKPKPRPKPLTLVEQLMEEVREGIGMLRERPELLLTTILALLTVYCLFTGRYKIVLALMVIILLLLWHYGYLRVPQAPVLPAIHTKEVILIALVLIGLILVRRGSYRTALAVLILILALWLII